MSTTKYILYADDDPDDRYFVVRAFQENVRNVEVMICDSGEKLLEFLDGCSTENYPCLIILDINMPRIGGKDALRQIRKNPEYQNIPVVLFTTSSDNSDMMFARANGAGFVTKPINMEQMRQIVDKFLEHCSYGLLFDRIKSSGL